jgi:hypothetical protein
MLEAHRRNHTSQDRPFTGFIPENSIVFTGSASLPPRGERRRSRSAAVRALADGTWQAP